MKCGYFTCSKNALLSLNILYILIAILLVGVAIYAKVVSLLNSYTIIGAVIGCGVFLLLLSCMGFMGAVKHHQICLFFYMIILFLLFLVQFSLAVALLAIPESTQQRLVKTGWESSSNNTQIDYMKMGRCCGLDSWSDSNLGYCPETLVCCEGVNAKQHCCNPSNNDTGTCTCENCNDVLKGNLNTGYKVTGAIGLFISITELIGVWLSARFRNQKDPTADPNAFL